MLSRIKDADASADAEATAKVKVWPVWLAGPLMIVFGATLAVFVGFDDESVETRWLAVAAGGTLVGLLLHASRDVVATWRKEVGEKPSETSDKRWGTVTGIGHGLVLVGATYVAAIYVSKAVPGMSDVRNKVGDWLLAWGPWPLAIAFFALAVYAVAVWIKALARLGKMLWCRIADRRKRGTGAVPVVTAAPEASSTAPEASSTAPEESSTAPEASSTAPVVTATPLASSERVTQPYSAVIAGMAITLLGSIIFTLWLTGKDRVER